MMKEKHKNKKIIKVQKVFVFLIVFAVFMFLCFFGLTRSVAP